MEQVNAVSTVAEVHPRMSWGAILAGWVVAIGVAELLYVGGLALGFSAFDAHNAAATAKGIGIGTIAWVALTWATAMLIGGMFASWFDGKNDTTMGTMHGVTVWGLSVAASGLMLASGLGHAVHGGAAMAAGGMHAGASMFHDGQADGTLGDATAIVRAQLAKAVAQGNGAAAVGGAPDGNTAGGDPPAQATASGATDSGSTGSDKPESSMNQRSSMARGGGMELVAIALMKGNKDTARALLAAQTTLTPAAVDQVLQTESAEVDKYRAEVEADANKAAHYTATALGIGVLSMLIGLLFSAIGGWLGANHVHRVYHLRSYVPQDVRR